VLPPSSPTAAEPASVGATELRAAAVTTTSLSRPALSLASLQEAEPTIMSAIDNRNGAGAQVMAGMLANGLGRRSELS
jgi:hypothetical protein